MTEAQQNSDHVTCHCRIIDVFKLEGGWITRDAETECWRELVDPVVVDIDCGIIRLGADSTPIQWEIVQSAGPGWDFVAEKREPGNTVLSRLRVRLWEVRPQLALTINGFTFVTGICGPFHQEGGGHRRDADGVRSSDS